MSHPPVYFLYRARKVRAGHNQSTVMARYHRVRPKPQHHSVPTPAAPAQPKGGNKPSLAEAKEMHARLQAAAESLYAERSGTELDASIERCKKLLAIHDRELAIVGDSDFTKPHRWTVSPSIAYRVDRMLHDLLERRERLKAECLAMVKHALAEMSAAEASLCPPKSPQAASQAGSEPTPQPPQGAKEPADAAETVATA